MGKSVDIGNSAIVGAEEGPRRGLTRGIRFIRAARAKAN